jgi:hypothetical protein
MDEIGFHIYLIDIHLALNDQPGFKICRTVLEQI